MPIHPTAVIDKLAQIDAAAEVGAYAVIEGGVTIGPQTHIYPHAYVGRGARIGARVQIHPFAVVSHHPQDLAWDRSESYAQIGDDTIIREHATVHRGSLPGSKTVVGRRVYLMTTAHVAHNCVVEDDVIIANGGLLGGHVHVGRKTFISGHSAAHQFLRIGELAMVGRAARLARDVPPFMTVVTDRVLGPNVVGLRRAGLSSAERLELRQCYHVLYRSDLIPSEAIQAIVRSVETDAGRRLADFLTAPSKRGLMRNRRRSGSGALGSDEPCTS